MGWVFLEHLQADSGSDDSKVMVMNIAGFCRRGRFDQMAGRTPTGPSGLRRIVMLGMDSNRPGISKFFIFAMAGETEIVVMIRFGQLRSTGPSMRVMAIKTEDPGKIMTALFKVMPLLVMGFGMGLGIAPFPRLELVIVGQRFA